MFDLNMTTRNGIMNFEHLLDTFTPFLFRKQEFNSKTMPQDMITIMELHQSSSCQYRDKSCNELIHLYN